MLSGKHASPFIKKKKDWADRRIDARSYNHRCYRVLVGRCRCTVGPNISEASRAIKLVGGLDAPIRGSGSPSTRTRIRMVISSKNIEFQIRRLHITSIRPIFLKFLDDPSHKTQPPLRIPAPLRACDRLDMITASHLVGEALSVFRESPHHVSALN